MDLADHGHPVLGLGVVDRVAAGDQEAALLGDVLATELAQRLSDAAIAAIISTDIATDGTLAGPNLQALRAMAEASRVPVIASGGIGCMADLL